MDTIYGIAIFSITLLVGVVCLFKNSSDHIFLWASLLAYLLALGVAQELMNNNSVPYVSGLGAFIVGQVALFIAKRTKTYWPLWVAGAAASIMLGDALFVWFQIIQFDLTGWALFAYQSWGNLMHYVALSALVSHPRIAKYVGYKPSWTYS